MLPETTETGPDENGYFTRIEYKINEKNNQVKIITRFKKYMYTKKVYSSAIERDKNWVKFGEATSKNNKSVTYFSDELVFMEPPPKNGYSTIKEEETEEETKELKIKEEVQLKIKKEEFKDDKPKIICKKCNGSHWSRMCGINMEKEKKEEEKEYEPQKTTIQIMNLGKDVNESDLYDLFSQIGTVKRIFVARDYDTQTSKGFGIATFASEKDTENIIKRFNNYGFNNLIMHLSLV
jgi:RNA recognition motif-containing protein